LTALSDGGDWESVTELDKALMIEPPAIKDKLPELLILPALIMSWKALKLRLTLLVYGVEKC